MDRNRKMKVSEESKGPEGENLRGVKQYNVYIES